MIQRAQWTATIANGQTTSDTVDLYGYQMVALQVPTMTAATISFLGSEDGVTFTAVKDSAGALVSYTHASPSVVLVSSAHFSQFPRFIQIVSAGAEGAQRLIKVIGSTVSG